MPEQATVSNEEFVKLDPPRIEMGKALLIAGLKVRYDCTMRTEIPLLWQRFMPLVGGIDGKAGREAYGVMFNNDGAGNFDYMAGVPVMDALGVSAALSTISIPAQRYAVFAHRGHVSELHKTAYTVWREWLPASTFKPTEGPHFERYGKDFNPEGHTGAELWIPIAKEENK